VVDEAFMDCVPGETASLAGETLDGLVVLRSLTKHWSIPGVRAGYLLAAPRAVAELGRQQVPWSVSTTAAAAVEACTTGRAAAEATRRAHEIAAWRDHLTRGLAGLGLDHLPSAASFVLVRAGAGTRARRRAQGVAVRRADTCPGLDDTWIRGAVRPPDLTDRLLAALGDLLPATGSTARPSALQETH
jgi:histidinol-phosphate/aromatic aminotransferase/cobyric acid decarboxylase-like protein